VTYGMQTSKQAYTRTGTMKSH